jgi:hypothetical protein
VLESGCNKREALEHSQGKSFADLLRGFKEDSERPSAVSLTLKYRII